MSWSFEEYVAGMSDEMRQEFEPELTRMRLRDEAAEAYERGVHGWKRWLCWAALFAINGAVFIAAEAMFPGAAWTLTYVGLVLDAVLVVVCAWDIVRDSRRGWEYQRYAR